MGKIESAENKNQLVTNLISMHDKEDKTTQTRSTDDLWTSADDKDGECACETDKIHRPSVDVICMYNKEGPY